MKKLITYILGLFILTSTTAYALGAAPLRIEFTALPGETVKGQVSVYNDSDTTQTIVIDKGDFIVNGDEDIEFMDDVNEDNLYSLQDWIYIPNSEITLGPKEKGVVPYEIRVPEDAPSQGYYGSLFIKNKPKTTVREIAGATVSVRVAHLVLLKVEGALYEKINIEDFNVVQQNEQGLSEFDIVLINEGNVHNSPTGQIEVIDEQGNLVDMVLINRDEYNVLPESKKTYKQPCKLHDLPPGIYYVILESKTDMGKLLEAEMKIEKTSEGEINILEKKLGEVNGDNLKEMLSKTRVTRNSILVAIGIFLFAVSFVAIARYCFKCANILNGKHKKRKAKSKKRVVKGKKK